MTLGAVTLSAQLGKLSLQVEDALLWPDLGSKWLLVLTGCLIVGTHVMTAVHAPHHEEHHEWAGHKEEEKEVPHRAQPPLCE